MSRSLKASQNPSFLVSRCPPSTNAPPSPAPARYSHPLGCKWSGTSVFVATATTTLSLMVVVETPGAVMADNALSLRATSWLGRPRARTHAHTHAFHSNPLCIDFAVWLKTQQVGVSTSPAPPKSISAHSLYIRTQQVACLSDARRTHSCIHRECWRRQAGTSGLGQY